MRRKCGLLLVGLSCAHCGAQLDPAWVTTFRDGDDFAAYALAVDGAGNSFVAYTIERQNDEDVALVKFSPDGAFQWQVTYDGPSDQDIAADATLSADGSAVYVLGRTRTLNFGDADYVILKYDAQTGSHLWTRTWDAGDLAIESPQSIVGMPDGGVVATGGAGTDGFMLDFGTVRYDAAGNEMWARTFRGSGRFLFDSDLAYDVACDSSGNVVVNGLATLFNGTEFRTIKYDGITGETIWSSSYQSGTGPRDLAIAPDGDVIVLGEDPQGFDRRWVVIRYAGSSGERVWMTGVDPGADESVRSVSVDALGNVYATGATDPDGDDGNGNQNMITIALDSDSGNLLWLDEFGGNDGGEFDVGSDLWADGEGSVFVVGMTGTLALVGERFERDAIIRRLDASTGAELDRGLIDLTEPGGLTRQDSFAEVGFDDLGHALVRGLSSGDVGVVPKMIIARFDLGRGCRADIDGDGDADGDDFFTYLDLFAAGDPDADLDGDGDRDADDFFAYLDLFAQGCP
ncbi:MAG: PQQ-binding-like beta-propeller repeat protein [Phycisphaeraceae bacterium]|nr:PQQ-binding-like beta-propeller repeat protein [Phycisphaeraceae bacterium]